MCVQNCPLLFRLRPAQVNVTKSVFSCKGPTCKEAELFSASMHQKFHTQKPLTTALQHGPSQEICRLQQHFASCNTHSIKQLSHYGWAPADILSSQRWVRNISGCKGNDVIVSEHCRTSICQPVKDRSDLYKTGTGTGTVCLESKTYSSEAFKS